MLTTVIISLSILGVLGVLFGLGLAYASKKFSVETDPRVDRICELLPNANCGACGFAGCNAFAEQLVHGSLDVNTCKVCASEAKSVISSVLGKELVNQEREIAVIHCMRETIPARFEYNGIQDCRSALLVNGGFTTCQYGCLGLGTCATVCPFEALYMGEDGLPHVVDEKCTGCGNCAKVCPRGMITIAPMSRDVHILCNSKHDGKYTIGCCNHGCIGCKRCEKACPAGAIAVKDFLACIDYTKCVVCGACVDVCPTGAIGDYSLFRGKQSAKWRSGLAAK
ncbi:MAG: RnfABCDGE type electron transport complex subunit B [Candidatus Brocadiia bacterium]